MIVRRPVRAASRRAFTLLEVLVVVAIIVVLAGVGIYALMPRYESAKEDLSKAKMKALSNACQMYKLKHDDFPPSLEMLVTDPEGNQFIQQDALRDPWGQPYGYNPAGPNHGGIEPDIWVNRPNKQIGNWQPLKP